MRAALSEADYSFAPLPCKIKKEYIVGENKMPISPELLEILRCPKCKSTVEMKPDQSGLKCTNEECALVYPIRDEIPVMLIEEAAVEK